MQPDLTKHSRTSFSAFPLFFTIQNNSCPLAFLSTNTFSYFSLITPSPTILHHPFALFCCDSSPNLITFLHLYVLSYHILSCLFLLLFTLPPPPLHLPHHHVISFIVLLSLVMLYSSAPHSSSSLSSSSCPLPCGDLFSSFIYHETLHYTTIHTPYSLRFDTILFHTNPYCIMHPFHLFNPSFPYPSHFLPYLIIYQPINMSHVIYHTSHHTSHHVTSHYFVLQYPVLFSLRLLSFVVCVSHRR